MNNKEKKPLIFAHRGYAGKYPENTKIAFDKAIENNFDGLEMDIRITKDKKSVVIHDSTIDRTNLTHKGLVKDYTLSELKEINFVGEFKKFKDFCEILTFEEFYDEYIGKIKYINIEIKDDSLELRDLVYNKIQKYEGSIIYINTKHLNISKWFLEKCKDSEYVVVSYRPDDWIDIDEEEAHQYDYIDCHERRYLKNPTVHNNIKIPKTIFLKTSTKEIFDKMCKIENVKFITANFPRKYFDNLLAYTFGG